MVLGARLQSSGVWQAVQPWAFTAGTPQAKGQIRHIPRAATLARSEQIQSGEQTSQGKKQEGKRIVLSGSDDNGNVLHGQEDLLEANRHWHEAAFPQYLQSEKDEFCEEWDEALQVAERQKSSQAGDLHPRSVSPDNPIWQSILKEAGRDAGKEPLLSSFLYASILSHDNFQDCLAFVLANRLSTPTLLATEYYETFQTVFRENDSIVQAALADLAAVRERDPSCHSYSNALLFYKGYHAIQVHRIANHLWTLGLEVSARALQARVSEVFAMDIHPQAQFGKGILMDHGTGIVVGQTAEIGNNVSILQNVTLGGTGKEHGDRHPKVNDNVLIGAAATVLGNITIGKGAMVAAGSLVLKTVPPKTMVAGSPAKEIGKIHGNPALKMQHWLKTVNPESDPFSDAFEAMIRTKSGEAAHHSSVPNSPPLPQEHKDEEDGSAQLRHDEPQVVNRLSSQSREGDATESPAEQQSSDVRREQDDSTDVGNNLEQHSRQKADRVIGVRSDIAAHRLWPEPEEPEYYL